MTAKKEPQPLSGIELIPAAAVRKIFGISHQTLWRWLNGDHDNRTGKTTPPVADFPKPVVINSRRYWRKADIEEFIENKR
jgi:predicted DNA-binding transcriptional regulator AlpA